MSVGPAGLGSQRDVRSMDRLTDERIVRKSQSQPTMHNSNKKTQAIVNWSLVVGDYTARCTHDNRLALAWWHQCGASDSRLIVYCHVATLGLFVHRQHTCASVVKQYIVIAGSVVQWYKVLE